MAHARAGHTHRRWRLSGHKKAHVDVVRNDINVTPLVDVMLVLLIIFMLMVLLMGRGHDVNLPQAHNYSQEKDKLQPVVTIDVEGTMFVEKNKIGPVNDATLKEMELQIELGWKNHDEANGRVYLKADGLAPYDSVYPVLMYLNKNMALQSVDLAIAKDSKGDD